MTDYNGKIIELLAILKRNEKTYLQIKLTNKQEMELFWEIDEHTANHLNALFDFGSNHKYRLSLSTAYNVVTNQHVSFLTKTYLENSQRDPFVCSLEYKNNIEIIKNVQEIEDIYELSFVSKSLPTCNEEKIKQEDPLIEKNPEEKKEIEQVQVAESKQVVIFKGNRRLFQWASVAIVSIICVILFGYFSFSGQNKPDDQMKIANAKEEIKVEKSGTVELVDSKLESSNTRGSQVLDGKQTDTTGEPKVPDVKAETSGEQLIPEIKQAKTHEQPSINEVELEYSLTYSIPNGSVALTFDDGPSRYTAEIVNILKSYNVGGTFFFIGYNVEKYPEYVELVHSNGYSIGSHTMNHVKMANISYEEQEDELLQSMRVIENITNEKVELFRPPYGAINEQTKELPNNLQAKMILWNKDTRDWQSHDPEKIFNYLYNSDPSGSIILMHESQAVIDALPRIIEYLKEQNLQIVNLK